MKEKGKKLSAVLLAGILFATLLTGCSSPERTGLSGASNTGRATQAAAEQPAGSPSDQAGGKSVGEFSTQDVNGNPYTKEMFRDHDLTLVNIFTTWCTPCVEEMPDLEKLYQQVKDKGVNVVGVVLDVVNEKGEIVRSDLERAQTLVERTGVTYPVLLPDSTYMNGRLTGIDGFPETFFVDKDGNIVGETYGGSGDFDYWLSVVETELAKIKGGN